MDFIYEYVERFFERLPLSKNNRRVKEAFIAEIAKEYHELKKENSDEKSIQILNDKYKWMDDIRKGNGVPGVDRSLNGLTLSEEGVVFQPSEEEYRTERPYQLLEELCGVTFCYTREKADFQFDCSEQFVVFALDKNRNYFGSIGGHCDLSELNVPIGYVRQDGLYGRIANNLKEFLELAVYYPFWYDVIKLERMRKEYNLDQLEQAWAMKIPDFYQKQKELSDVLQIQKNEKAIEVLLDNLRMKSEFVICDIEEEGKHYEKFCN